MRCCIAPMWCDDKQGRACALASAEGDVGEVVWGEAVAGAADGHDDIGVTDGLELAAEGADAGGNDVTRYFVRTVIS